MSSVGAIIRDQRILGRVPRSPQGIALLAAGIVLFVLCAGAEGTFSEFTAQFKMLIEQAPGSETPAIVLEMVRSCLESVLILSVVYCVAGFGLTYLHNGVACSFRIAREKPKSIGLAARAIGSVAVMLASTICAGVIFFRIVSQGARLYRASSGAWPPAANALVVRYLTLFGFAAVCIGAGCVAAAWIVFVRDAHRHQAGGGDG